MKINEAYEAAVEEKKESIEIAYKDELGRQKHANINFVKNEVTVHGVYGTLPFGVFAANDFNVEIKEEVIAEEPKAEEVIVPEPEQVIEEPVIVETEEPKAE